MKDKISTAYNSGYTATQDKPASSVQQLKAKILRLIMDDAYACSWQTMGQYRSGLVKEIAKLSAI